MFKDVSQDLLAELLDLSVSEEVQAGSPTCTPSSCLCCWTGSGTCCH
jgi:hypothetical protein